jgi:hypothetical protein
VYKDQGSALGKKVEDRSQAEGLLDKDGGVGWPVDGAALQAAGAFPPTTQGGGRHGGLAQG